jgi:hypothetical protein
MRTTTNCLDPDQIITIKVKVMGVLMDVPITAADAEQVARGQREWEIEKQKRAGRARAALQRYRRTKIDRDRTTALEALSRCSNYASSDDRLSTVLSLIGGAPPEIFWPTLINEWSGCDATWPDRKWLLEGMERAGQADPYFSSGQRKFFRTLPRLVQVFRGCSQSRIRGLAWTLDSSVAQGFARGHRNIRVPKPVIASAVIPKEHIFFVTDDRNEKEVVLKPRRLRGLKFEPF